MRVVPLILAAAALGAASDPYAPLDRLLKARVKDGVVDYAGLAKEKKALDEYLKALAAADLGPMGRDERLAFWINAYNAFTLKLVLENRPGLKSIRDLEDPWKRKRWKVAGATYSLDAIENEVIRKRFAEPRIHFALVCAAVSCPPLRAEAYVADRLDEQLDDQARAFLRDPKRGFRRGAGKVYLSKLFDWYRKDFEKGGATVVDFVLPFLADEDRRWVKANRDGLAVEFLPYDWSLNGP